MACHLPLRSFSPSSMTTLHQLVNVTDEQSITLCGERILTDGLPPPPSFFPSSSFSPSSPLPQLLLILLLLRALQSFLQQEVSPLTSPPNDQAQCWLPLLRNCFSLKVLLVSPTRMTKSRFCCFNAKRLFSATENNTHKWRCVEVCANQAEMDRRR